MAEKSQTLTIEEFTKRELPAEVEGLLSRVNGGSFMKCHAAIYRETGIWIEELVPVFQRLDATLGLADARPEFARG